MKTTEFKQKLHDYIEMADEKKIKAIYAIVEDDIEETYNYWENKNFVAELDRRTKEYENGKAKVYSLDELESNARKSFNAKKNSRK